MNDRESAALKSASIGIATLRLWCGAWFLLMASLKLPVWGPDADWAERFAAWFETVASTGAHPAYRGFLKVLLPHATAVSYVIAGAEIAIGVAFVLGFFTRAACAGAILLYANYWLATARLGYTAIAPSLTIAVTAACLWLGEAGMHYGIDGWRARRKSTTLTPPITGRG